MGIACPFRFVSSLPGQWQFSVWKHQFSLPRFPWSASCALQHIDSSSLQKSRESDSRNCPGLPERNTQGPWTSVSSWPKFRPSKGVSPETWWDSTVTASIPDSKRPKKPQRAVLWASYFACPRKVLEPNLVRPSRIAWDGLFTIHGKQRSGNRWDWYHVVLPLEHAAINSEPSQDR